VISRDDDLTAMITGLALALAIPYSSSGIL